MRSLSIVVIAPFITVAVKCGSIAIVRSPSIVGGVAPFITVFMRLLSIVVIAPFITVAVKRGSIAIVR